MAGSTVLSQVLGLKINIKLTSHTDRHSCHKQETMLQCNAMAILFRTQTTDY